MLHILVRYSREDYEFANRLAADLRREGAGVALAALNAAGGDRSDSALATAIARCDRMLLILPPDALDSAVSIDDVVTVATERKIPMVAVLCRYRDIPPPLRDFEVVDLRKHYAAGIRKLLANVAPARRGQAGTPATPATQTARQQGAETPNAAKIPTGTHRGRSLRLLGGSLLVLSIAGLMGVMVVAQSALDAATVWLALGVGLVLVFLVAFAGVKSLKRGKQIAALSAQALLAQDTRPPVVYLRSFQDDSATAEGGLRALPLVGGLIMGGMIAMLDLAGGTATEEEQLAEALHDVGPFVAVGKPGEKLPELGAARMYVQDSEWQQVVRGLMSRARLVVLRAGKTDGLWWEVETAAQIVRPERLVFLLPYEREHYELFRSRAETIFRCRLPGYPEGKKKGDAGSVQGIMYFEPDGTPHFLQPQGFYRTAKPWVQSFKAMLLPVFQQLHIDVKTPKKSVWKTLLLVVLIPIVSVMAVFVVLGIIGGVMRLLNN